MDDTLIINGQKFTQVGWNSQAGRILERTYAANDGSGLMVVIDFRHTEGGCE